MLVAQLCLTLCDPMEYSLPDSSVHGILQTRILEWVAISFSRESFQPGIEPRSTALQGDSCGGLSCVGGYLVTFLATIKKAEC